MGMTVNAGRTAFLPPDRGGRQHLKIMQLLAAVEADGARAAGRDAHHDRRAPAPRHDRRRHHRLARSGLGPPAGDAAHARRRVRRRDRSTPPPSSEHAAGARAAATGETRRADPVAEELAAKRARALRHALAEYELRSYVITPGRPLGEILAR